MFKYTVAICNYNMDETLEESVRSIIDQVTDEFEVLVVDDGSSDNSVEILKKLDEEYENFRFLALERNENRNLGETRNISIRKAKGDYILIQMDADDVYYEGILDFVEIYHQIENQVDFDFYLKGESTNIAPKELLLDISYHNLGRGEDADLWRRLASNGAIIRLKHKPFWQPIGYYKSFWDKIKCNFGATATYIQTGVSFWGNNRWRIKNNCKYFLKDLVMYPLAYIPAKLRKQFQVPTEFNSRGDLSRKLPFRTLSEIENHYNIKIDKSKLSPRGKEIFFGFDDQKENQSKK